MNDYSMPYTICMNFFLKIRLYKVTTVIWTFIFLFVLIVILFYNETVYVLQVSLRARGARILQWQSNNLHVSNGGNIKALYIGYIKPTRCSKNHMGLKDRII